MGGGVLSGFFAGFFGTGGAIRGITLSMYDLQMGTFIATSAAIDLAVDLSRSAVYISSGFLNREILYFRNYLFVIAIVAFIVAFAPFTAFAIHVFVFACLVFARVVPVSGLSF